MKILCLNSGSSSIKCSLYDFNAPDLKSPLWKAALQWKNSFDSPILSISNSQGMRHSQALKETNPFKALEFLLSLLLEGQMAVLQSFQEIKVAGHRIVHGKDLFTSSIRITEDVKQKIKELSELAPLHNFFEIEGIEVLEKLIPEIPQIAVFDTAFHHTLPQAAKIYPGPYAWHEIGIRRYGFHGISFQYCTRRAYEILGKSQNVKMVICHLGSGASLCAVREGKSIDTTMGFTPLEGLMMDTRSGSIDPGIILHLLEKKQMNLQGMTEELYKKSGLLGISGFSSDMQDILEKAGENERAKLALDIYLHRLSSCLGSMIAALKGLDVLVFTAGIGENSPLIREKICSHFSFLRVKLDSEKNARIAHEDSILSAHDSKVKVLLIHTQEDFEIARECQQLIS